jgi:hypothetical protein
MADSQADRQPGTEADLLASPAAMSLVDSQAGRQHDTEADQPTSPAVWRIAVRQSGTKADQPTSPAAWRKKLTAKLLDRPAQRLTSPPHRLLGENS